MIGAKGKVRNEMKEMPSIGQYAVSGLIDGLLAKKQELIQTAQAMADVVKSTFQSALDIHSPSRVFKGFGININEGLIEGIQQSTSNLKRAMNNVYGSLAGSAGQMMKQQNRTPAINSVLQQPSQTTIENNYNFTYQSPKAIDPYEASRLARNSLRELALQI